jgi:hypothetical protein
MTKLQTYRVDEPEDKSTLVQASTPRRALEAHFGDRLRPGKGRYGQLTNGQYVCALLVHGGRCDYPDARTTRELR